jgi:hypothetical protein
MSSQLAALWAEPPWGAEPRFELEPVVQQASALPTEPRCTLTEPRCTLHRIIFMFAARPLIGRPSLNNWAGVIGKGNRYNTRWRPN